MDFGTGSDVGTTLSLYNNNKIFQHLNASRDEGIEQELLLRHNRHSGAKSTLSSLPYDEMNRNLRRH